MMSFFRTDKIKNQKHMKTQAFLRAKIFITSLSDNCQFLIRKSVKRISFFPSLYCKASMTVEASIAVPLFLFFIINILLAFDMLHLHSRIAGAMHQTGNQMIFSGYAYKSVEEKGISLEGISSVILSEGYARGKVISLLGSDYLNNTCLEAGTAGLHFMKSSVMKENDVVDLIASYRVKPLIRTIGFPSFPMENRYYGRAWTGYDVENGLGDRNDEDPIVFVAETGVVYHLSRSCTYLCPSVEMISAFMKEDIRNEYGEKYYACERCGEGGIPAILYITGQGNRYHNSLHCSGLKRTVHSMHLSEAGGKGRCSKCG